MIQTTESFQMGDTLSQTDGDGGPSTGGRREPLPRQVYLALRLKELATDLHALVSERQNLNVALKDHASASPTDVRKMRERRGYLAIRINVLRAEQQDLVLQKEALPSVAQSQVGVRKKKAKAA
jgi:hypothetical protein